MPMIVTTPARAQALSTPRRRTLLAWSAAAGLGALAGCDALPTLPGQRPAWEARLQGDTLALLGEVHDNPLGHRERLAALRRAVAAGWRPAVLMEQFDTDRQADLDRARRERPGDVPHLIEQASPARAGWDWDHYRSVLALALDAELPLVAANLARAEAGRLVRSEAEAVFGEERSRALGLVPGPAADWQAAQEAEIAAGHCGALPTDLLPGMARAQFARDAVMAELLRTHGERGAVLLAGNGHVRRDLGVPRWLRAVPAARVLAVGFLEETADDGEGGGEKGLPANAFDAIVEVAPATREEDPCAALR